LTWRGSASSDQTTASNSIMKVCLYAVATGKYARMAEGLISSLRDRGVEYDFIAFSDSVVGGASDTIPVEPLSAPSVYFQKIAMLRHLSSLGYDYLVCMDCDILCLRTFSVDRFLDLPCFAILEDNLEDCASRKNDPPRRNRTWYGFSLEDFTKLILSKNPEVSRPLFGLNAGFFGVRSDLCDEFVDWHEKVTEFDRSEEPGLVLAIHSMTNDLSRLSIKTNSDLILPVIGDPKEVLRSGIVEYFSPFTSWSTQDSPALAHFCFHGKQVVSDYRSKVQ